MRPILGETLACALLRGPLGMARCEPRRKRTPNSYPPQFEVLLAHCLSSNRALGPFSGALRIDFHYVCDQGHKRKAVA